ncbi:NADH dehydrogenase [Brevundimonas sp. AAP58]|uniref:NAD(P)/FAD-dependent oxidoreductase n=1 Tax=Brevundimonas sp. AAP58 TaxID=1523422 RepID=UPI0006B915FB|nr:NAD(P)/FAD-dependent oxidoreductase [Brevundimonas sp. AAP58]KPF79485.1 NADH dehydrogenase [Brevundimonas sp. AAP58]
MLKTTGADTAKTSPPPVVPRKTQIVVVGGGAGGLGLAAKLGRTFGRKRFDIILVDRNPTHIWKPLLHEVAAGSLDANLDEVGYRGHAFRWRYRFFDGSLDGIDRDTRHIHIAPIHDETGREIIAGHRIRYDYLVLAVGSVSNDFGTPGARDHALLLDDRTQADRFRKMLLNQCLRVSRAMMADPGSDARVRVVIVGGGATGVELAAELFNAAQGLAYYGLEVFDDSRLSVTLVEAGPRILPALPERLSQAAKAELEAIGVRVITGSKVTEVTADGVMTAGGEFIRADLRVWASGVKGPEFLADIGGLETTPSNQLVVRDTLQTTRDDRIFAIGDCARYVPTGSDRPIPPRAQAAHQMASTAFQNLKALVRGGPLKPFVYRDQGSLVSLSRYSTVGSLMGNLVGGRMAVEGRLARLIYMSLYRLHILTIHGWTKGLALIALGHVNQVIRPRLKLH